MRRQKRVRIFAPGDVGGNAYGYMVRGGGYESGPHEAYASAVAARTRILRNLAEDETE